ncbi:multidrug effflux MFS transporter [Frateuria sp. STR12]|uniref:multidrug effflux MFS transporter n=1 Tax=Frateuria hangzhouensis TaxID=2995589 RepID=UPI002260DF16|nr:multidrug effflux MFS transporter [Frateuria sp. STR12]MCX7512314.1 multidrug effflux MFS transporter [Frateuria sp. STR12]
MSCRSADSGTDAANGASTTRRGPARMPQPALALLAFMMALAPFGDTEYTPAMPAIAHALAADYGLVQLTMTFYLAGSAISQLGLGPLADRYGRRPVMLGGTAVLTVGFLLSLASVSIWPLLGSRLVQGLGASAGSVVADAAVRDAFPAERRQRVYAKLNAAFALAPAVGPVAGVWLARAFGWRANFAVLAALGMLLWFAVWRWLPETRPCPDHRALRPRRLWRTWRRILGTPRFVVFALLGGCAVGVVYTALIGAPDLVINVLNEGSGAIVIVAASILVAFVAGAGLCIWLTPRSAYLRILAAGLAILLAGSLALLAVALLLGAEGSLAAFLIPISVCFCGVGLVVPVATAKAMAPFRRTAGHAASLLGFVRMGVAALGTVAMSVLHEGSVLDIPIVFLALSGATAAVFAIHVARERRQPGVASRFAG